jgi:predicted small secreted protein
MKRIAIVLTMLLACVSFSAANTITLTSGVGDLSPAGYSFFLSNHSLGFFTGSPSDFPFTAGLQNCEPCDPRGLIPLLSDGGLSVNSAGQIYDGLIDFRAVSFVSSLAANGMLTVTYKASANLDFLLCTDTTCDTNTALLVWEPRELWLVTAVFAPDPYVSGAYDFVHASFQAPVVPEPSSMLLVGSGIMVLIGKVRNTRKD